MQNDTFANRLNKALKDNDMSPTELAKKTNIDKSSISNYLSGNYKAGQDNLTIIADALHVSEPWLMGYDIDKVNNEINSNTINNKRQILFDKTKDLLSDDDWATIEFIMNKTIANYEKNKNNIE